MADLSDIVVTDWAPDQVKELLDKLISKTKSIHNKSYKAVESSLNWEEISIKGKSAAECREVYQRAIGKKYPDMPKKPMTAFSIFVKKKSKKMVGVNARDRMAQLGKDWSALSEEKKELYRQKYLKLKKKYEEEMEVFKKNHPEAPLSGSGVSSSRPQPPQPSRVFVDARMQKEQAKHPNLSHGELLKKLLRKYEKLSDKKKLKWINRAKDMLATYQEQCNSYISQHPSASLKPPVLHLTKKEQQIWDQSVGKPVVPPPKNVFLYYCHSNRETVAHLKIAEQSKILSTSYHKLSEDELRETKHKFQQEVETYINEYTQYYESLGEEEKQREKPPEVVLAGYYKILQRNTPKPVEAQKTTGKHKEKNNPASSSSFQSPRLRKRSKSLSEVLPRHVVNHKVSDSEEEEEEDGSDDATPPSSQQTPSQNQHSDTRKRKIDSPAASPSKKKKHDESPLKSKAVIRDDLLAMWSPLKVKNEGTSSQEDQSPSPSSRKEHKSPKKSKKKSKDPEM